jgi:hypothetical protein
MKLSSAPIALALLAVPSLAVALNTPTAEETGPPVVPYLCSDGHTANVLYESGNDYLHARARVEHEGHTYELEAAPTLYGVRYRTESAAEDGDTLAWTLRGEQAVLSEAPDTDSYTREEHELLRCIRLRGGAPAATEGHGEGHH